MAESKKPDNGSSPDGDRASSSARDLAAVAVETIQDLTGYQADAVTSLQWDGNSWLVTVDVLELKRVPETTDVLGSYVVQLDDEGGLLGYRRTRRFHRSQLDREE
jgi:Gas vesicle synthesis protein GvpO